MRYYLLFFLFLCFYFNAISQYYNQYNSASRIAIVEYAKDINGFYQKYTNQSVNDVNNIVNIYAFDKKHNNLYVATYYGNYVITLIESDAKNIKKNKSIPKLKESEIEALVISVNNSLNERFAHLNLSREKFITDSIERERVQAEREEDNRRLALIEKARQDSIEAKNKRDQLKEYRSKHDWHWLPIEADLQTEYSSRYSSSFTLQCSLCDKSISSYTTDSILVVNIYNDTIYSIERKEGYLDYDYNVVHTYRVPRELANSSKYIYHLQAYSDSLLRTDTKWSKEIAQVINYKSYSEYVENLRDEAPYGFVVEWGWDNDYSMVTFDLEYMNLNKKTIKYLDVYWKISNDVGDVRLSGHFQGTGPVKQYEMVKWDWDSSGYFVAGDASIMDITKIIITYMNGKRQTITGNNIVYE